MNTIYALTVKLVILSFLTFNSLLVSAQERQGNIVEYFGKEKVERIEEGALLHVFQEGLTLNKMQLGLNSSTTPEDGVFGRYLMKDESGITEGQTYDVDFRGEPMNWKKTGDG